MQPPRRKVVRRAGSCQALAACLSQAPPCAQASFEEGFINNADPSVLRFLIASRDEVCPYGLPVHFATSLQSNLAGAFMNIAREGHALAGGHCRVPIC